jgi:peptide/nickel transport system permease protein
MIAVGLSSMPRFTRVMQAEVLAIRGREYVVAARALGAGTSTILVRHILPNSLSSVLVLGTLSISTAILAEATLSFLGLGPRPPTATWGSMISDGTSVLQAAPWVVLFPGLALTMTVLGFSLLGDGLRDALDVRLRDR